MAEQVFVARLIEGGQVRQAIEFEAPDPTTAWIEGNAGIDPLSGHWVEVQPKPEPQGELQFCPYQKLNPVSAAEDRRVGKGTVVSVGKDRKSLSNQAVRGFW